jgi:spermidine/putrescine-binding protein
MQEGRGRGRWWWRRHGHHRRCDPPAARGGARRAQVNDWAGYGDGAFYPEEKEFLWQQYQDATGDTPQFIEFVNDDVGYTEIAAGARYDVVHPCGYRFPDYLALDVLQPWDTSLISNFALLNPTLQQVGQIEGQQYFIVEDWGFIAPMYRADKVEPLEDSWSLLWDDRYGGKIAWINTLEMLSIAGYYHQVSDPWDMTDEELAEMRDFLISKKPLVRYLWNISSELFRSFKQEEVWIAYAWPDAFANALTSDWTSPTWSRRRSGSSGLADSVSSRTLRTTTTRTRTRTPGRVRKRPSSCSPGTSTGTRTKRWTSAWSHRRS